MRVDGLRRSRQAGGDGGIDDPASAPSRARPRLRRSRPGGRPRRARCPSTPGTDAIANAFSTPSADSIRQWSRASHRRARRRVHVVRRSTFGTWMPATRERRRPPRGRPGEGVDAVDADVDRLPRGRSEQRRRARRAPRPSRRRRDGVLEVDDHGVRARRRSPSRRVRAGRPGRRATSAAESRPSHDPFARAAARARRRRRRARRAPRPCRRRAAGRPSGSRRASRDRRAITFGIRSVPSSASSTAAIAPIAANCGSASDVARVVDRARSPPRPPRRRRAPRRASRSPIQAATAPSISSTCATRPEPVANHGSSTRSAAPDEPQHALGDRVGARRDRHPRAVGRAVDVARRVVARAVPGPRLQLAEQVARA